MKSVRTTIRLLREFTVREPELGVTELARRLDLDKATVHRMLRALMDERVVEQDAVSKRYRLGYAILDLATSRIQSIQCLSRAVDEIHLLRDRIEESVAIHVRDGHEMICLDFAEGTQSVRVGFWVGERSPVHATATGMAALSTLPDDQWRAIAARSLAASPLIQRMSEGKIKMLIAQARKNGFAIADETYQPGIRSIAVPVTDGQGRVALTLSIAAPAQRRSVGDLKKWAPHLIEAAQRVRQIMLGRREDAMIQRLGLGLAAGKSK